MNKKTYSFLGHTTNHILYVGQVSIITCVLIPNQDIEPMQYFKLLLLVLHAPLLLANPGFQVFHHNNKLAVNQSKIARTGLCQFPLRTGTLLHPVKKLKEFINFYYTSLVITCLHWYKLINMVPLVQQIQPQWDNMLLNSCHKPTNYNKGQYTMDNPVMMVDLLSKPNT